MMGVSLATPSSAPMSSVAASRFHTAFTAPGRLAPALDELVFTASSKVGEIVGPVETPFGWHLVRVEGREKLPGEWPLFPKPTAVGKRESPSRYFERPLREEDKKKK